MNVILNKGGTKERSVDVKKLQVPDMWHIVMRAGNVRDQKKILEVWHLCHDLLNHLKQSK